MEKHNFVPGLDDRHFCDSCRISGRGLVGVSDPIHEPSAPSDADKALINVYEIYGSSADKSCWDFTVCTDMETALETLESDLDALDEGQEVRVIFKRYTQVQMDEVIYE